MSQVVETEDYVFFLRKTLSLQTILADLDPSSCLDEEHQEKIAKMLDDAARQFREYQLMMPNGVQ